MRLAVEKDKERVIDILSAAFENNQSVLETCINDGQQLMRIRRLKKYAFDSCMNYGKVWITNDNNGCALVLFPDRKRFSFGSLLADIRLVYGVIGISKIFKTLAKEAKIKMHHPRTPFYHLWFIGVDPDHKSLGIGSGMMKELLKDADAMQRPLYLETSTPKNLPWYRSLGMEIYDELHLSYPLFFLRNLT